MSLFIVSPSPHAKATDSVQSIMYGVLYALVPALLVSFYCFGLGALITTVTAVAACVAFEWLAQKFLLKKEPSILDGSAALTGLLLAFNLPSTLPIWMVVAGSLFAIGAGKMSFGGLGQNIFNPALVGRVFLLMSFPAHMTVWPLPVENQMLYFDAVTGATPLSIMKEGLASGSTMMEIGWHLPSYWEMFLGTMGGSLGEISALALLLGGLFMLYKKIITWHIPVAVLGSMALFSGGLWLAAPELYAHPVFHLITGGAMLGAFFMATDMVTSPMSARGQILFGAGIGVLTIVIRTFGAYPEGISFAILIMNAFVPLINSGMKPKKFGY
jgi:Na+-translocating ferredoxin:NAD+ oxidoreductase subunit D